MIINSVAILSEQSESYDQGGNNESSEGFDIIKPGRRVKIKTLQVVKCQ